MVVIQNERGARCILNPESFELEKTSVWSFPDRGDWATHRGDYRGNWSPYVPRNLIFRYSKEGEWILDQFSGSGTTLVEAKLLNRNAIGVDINDDAIKMTRKRVDFGVDKNPRLEIRKGNACNLSFIKNDSIHLICMHPPYADIIRYSDGIPGDLSQLGVEDFLEGMGLVAGEAYRVLKPGRYCAFMIGDVRKHGRLYPVGFQTMEVFRNAGFVLKEIIIKEQHNCRSSDYWNGKENSFLLLAHEYIFVLQKMRYIQGGMLREDSEIDYDCEITDPLIENGVNVC